jgi:hypothetical protein
MVSRYSAAAAAPIIVVREMHVVEMSRDYDPTR